MSVASVKAVVNGQTYNLTYNSGTQAWEATATAPSTSSYGQSACTHTGLWEIQTAN